jgi:hypothetical protein
MMPLPNRGDPDMTDTFKVFVSYGQIAVFRSELDEPFNDWTEAHWVQGFAWRPESVSFSTVHDGGMADVAVVVVDDLEVQPQTRRAVRVPFTVPDGCAIEVGSISDGSVVDVPAGDYALVFENGGADNGDMWIRMSFCRTQPATPAILKGDPGEEPPAEFVMTAEPA